MYPGDVVVEVPPGPVKFTDFSWVLGFYRFWALSLTLQRNIHLTLAFYGNAKACQVNPQ